METAHKDPDLLAASVAYCGLICRLCFQKESCDGCKSANNRCERNLSDEGCYQRNCCSSKGYEGCWNCSELYSCEKGIFSAGNMSKIKAFSICIREDGIASFIDYVMRNMQRGLSVEKGRDYDGVSIEEVLKLLRSSLNY